MKRKKIKMESSSGRSEEIFLKKPAVAAFGWALLLGMMLWTGPAAAFAAGSEGVKAGPGEEAENYRITVQIEPGESYSRIKWFGIFPVRLTPQIALWVESETGEYIGTVYVSSSTAKDSWRGARTGRPEALPVYSHRAHRGEADIDTATGATPKGRGTAEVGGDLMLSEGTYRVRAEVNVSFDYNGRYRKEETGVNGQPSLVYEGFIEAGKEPVQVRLLPIGTGSVDGSSGVIHPGTEGLTTALDILKEISLSMVRF